MLHRGGEQSGGLELEYFVIQHSELAVEIGYRFLSENPPMKSPGECKAM